MSNGRNHKDLKIYPDLGRVAIKYGIAHLFRDWSSMRLMDSFHAVIGKDGKVRYTAKGWVTRQEFRQFCGRYGLRRAHERMTFDSPYFDGFFEYDGATDRIYIRSIEKVALYLMVTFGEPVNVAMTPIYIPVDSISRLRDFKAMVYATWLPEEIGVEISRARLSEKFGVCEETLRNWERVAPITKEYNRAYTPESEFDPETAPLPRDDRDDRDGEVYYWRQVVDGVMCVCWQLVNTYSRHGLKVGKKGQTRKIAARLREVRQGLNHGREAKEAYPVTRRYFNVEEIPARPSRIVNQPCYVKVPDLISHNERGSANMHMVSPTTPVGSKRGLTSQELIAIMNGEAFWNRKMLQYT